MKGKVLVVTSFLVLPWFRSMTIGTMPPLENKTRVLGSHIEVPTTLTTRQICVVEDKLGATVYSVPTMPEKQENIGYRNNKFGLYIYDTEDFVERAGDLVNSQGGRWGYVLIPINVHEQDYDKWRELFSQLREKELIPILQLWDVDPDNYEKPTRDLAHFLNSFSWPIKNRYVSVYNEPNDERFWHSRLDPENYAMVLSYTIQTFKAENENFFMLNGAFNATAPNGNGYMEESAFMYQMNQAVPGIFSQLDGWASHSYPQPAYRGYPSDYGRSSIRAYDWELSLLESHYNVTGLPVFITETGWPHAEGKETDFSYFDQFTVAQFIKSAYENVWLPDERVVAVTPFTIQYDPPHDHFSWVKKEDDGVYPQFETIQALPKISGDPPMVIQQEKKLLRCS